MDRELSHQQQQPQLNPLNARVGMALAYWAYPHKDEAQASKVLPHAVKVRRWWWPDASPCCPMPKARSRAFGLFRGKLCQV